MKSLILPLLVVLLASSAFGQINIDPPTRSFTKDGGGGSILTSGTGTWTAEKSASWITITPRTSGNAGESCIYVVGSNFSADTRQGVITIGGKTHTVNQTGYNAVLSPSSATANLGGSTGTISITLDAGVAWSAVSNASWVTVSPASGTSSGMVTYTVAPYGGVTTRTTSLTIAGKTFSVTQTGTDVNITPKSAEKAYSSDIIQVSATALSTTTWNVTPNVSWVSVVDPGNKFGDSTITLAVGTNPSFLERTGTVSIGSATFLITQAGTPNPILDINPKQATADPLGAYGNIAVLATPDAPWSAQSMSPWIVVSQGASGAGNGNIQYVASANPNLIPRTGTIRVNPPAYQPAVDLTWLLLAHVSGDSFDLSGWGRNPSGSLATRFSGLAPLTLSGPDFGRGSDNSFSLCLQFELGDLNTVNRLLEVTRASGSYSTVYVDADNRLAFRTAAETLTTDLTVQAGVTYQLVLTADASNMVRIYAAARGGNEIALVGRKAFAVAPFPADYVTPGRILVGSGQAPTPGNLTNAALGDLRIYGRDLNAREALATFLNAGSADPYAVGFTTSSPNPALLVVLDGSGVSANVTTSGEGLLFKGSWARSADKFGRPSRALQSDGTGRFVTLGSVFSQVTGSFTWQEAKSDAIARRGRLAVLNTALKVQFATSRGFSGHIGLSDEVTEGVWKWLDGSLLSYPNWSRNEPNNQASGAGEDYVAVGIDGTWNDGTGLGRDKYILEIKRPIAVLTNTSATYCYWIRLDTLPSGSTASVIQTGASGSLLEVVTGPALQLKNGSTTVTFPAPLKAGTWHHIVVSGASGGIARVVLDGQEIGNTSGLGSYDYSQLGDIGGWNGAIDQVAYYDGALTVPQIKAIYDAEKPNTVFHTVTQGTVNASISPSSISLPASGGTAATDLTIAQNVNWTATTATPWLSVTSPESGAGSTTVQVLAGANPTVYPRTGTVTVGGQTFTVTQAGLNADVSYEETVFSTDGGSGWVDVSPEGNAQWQAVSDVPWLTVAIGASGTGAGSVFIVADPYTNTSQSRTGSVTIAGKTVYFTQRGYTLSINPQVAQVGSNAGAGEFGVAAPISAVWEAIVTQPWITLVGGNTGLGNGTVRYSLAANTTGQARTGRIIVSGKEYSITQLASLLVTAQAGTGGTVSGGGAFDVNATATLTATGSAGYAFSHWTGDAVGSENPLQIAVDSNKSVQANFVPAAATEAFFEGGVQSGVQSVVANPNSFGLYNAQQLRSMAVGQPVLEVDPATGKGKIQFGIKQSQNLTSWSDLLINSADVFIRNGKLEVEFTRSGNAAFYRVFGSETGQ